MSEKKRDERKISGKEFFEGKIMNTMEYHWKCFEEAAAGLEGADIGMTVDEIGYNFLRHAAEIYQLSEGSEEFMKTLLGLPEERWTDIAKRCLSYAEDMTIVTQLSKILSEEGSDLERDPEEEDYEVLKTLVHYRAELQDVTALIYRARMHSMNTLSPLYMAIAKVGEAFDVVMCSREDVLETLQRCMAGTFPVRNFLDEEDDPKMWWMIPPPPADKTLEEALGVKITGIPLYEPSAENERLAMAADDDEELDDSDWMDDDNEE